MMGLVLTIHIISCVLLIILILIQAGKGGGLVESFSSVENMFGTKTSSFLTKTTTTFAIIFFLSCLTLATMSAKQSRSLMKDAAKLKPTTATATTAETPTQALPQATENAPVASGKQENRLP